MVNNVRRQLLNLRTDVYLFLYSSRSNVNVSLVSNRLKTIQQRNPKLNEASVSQLHYNSLSSCSLTSASVGTTKIICGV